MRKFLFLLLGVFLLFPVAIYFGNLADIPASKSVIVYLRDLVGMSASKETTDSDKKAEVIKIPAPYSHIGLVEAWRNLGTSNFADLLQLMAVPGNHDRWQAATEDFLNNPLHSAAFFSSSWSFWQAQQEKLNLIGYYQPWIDVFLLIQVAEVDGNYKAVAIGMTEPSSTISATTPTTVAQELTARLQHAEQTFQSVIQNPNAIDKMLNPEVIKKSKNSLNQYVNDLRNKLAVNNSENQNRSAILEWLNALQTGQVKEVQQLAPVSNEWLKQLQVVQLLKMDSEHWLLAACDPSQAERVLLVQLHISDHKALATEIQIWDAATAAGGVQ